ncbi:MAG: chromosome-partitioning protein ParB, chromosome partitioning protein, ParB family [Candidatus Peregrinibacteria bacterium GW2011_GWF2_38_29]|nr:MAG: chromosome-partitioning protein ParB, chromosome partitioning protein, ParB family [Candidatus Peregrinibacteria bacterium GW2011_GWF2_38_29]HBB02168.1 hypothetical protein [Candidatus Peregrinibacteria bacterium]
METRLQTSPLLETPPQERILNKDSLKAENLGQCTKGGMVLKNDSAQLIRLESLEGEQIFYIPIGWAIPNPDQPRENFEFDDIEKFDHDLLTNGQRDAAEVTPILIKGETHLKFILVDGERRWRSMKKQGAEYMKIKVKWYPNKEDIFEAAFNSTNRKNLNPIEEAKSYEKMIARRMIERKTDKKRATEILSKETGISITHIKGYLKLLTLDERMQRLVADGSMKASSGIEAADFLNGEDDLTGGAFTRRVANAAGALPHDKNGKRAKLGAEDIRDAMAEALGETGRPEDALRLKAETRCDGLVNTLGQLAERFKNIMGETDDKNDKSEKAKGKRARTEALLGEITSVLRDRQGQQAGEVMERMEYLIEVMQMFTARVLRVAMQPPALEIPEGAPTFAIATKRLTRIGKIDQFVVEKLAEASDKGTQYTAEELFEMTRTQSSVDDFSLFKGNLDTILPSMISGVKLRIDVNQKRVKDPTKEGKRTKYVNAYRLAWITGKA